MNVIIVIILLCTQEHPCNNRADPYYLLTRREQVTSFGL